MLARALQVLTATAMRHLHRAHAACIAAPHAACRCDVRSPCDGSTRQRYGPCSRFSRRRLSPAARGATVLLTPALKGASKVRAVLASSRCAASVRCVRRIFIVPSFASPGEVHPKVRCQRSRRRTGQRGLRPGCPRLGLGCQQLLLPRGAAQRAVAALWAPCFGPIRPDGAKGVQPAAPAARILSMFSAMQRGA